MPYSYKICLLFLHVIFQQISLPLGLLAVKSPANINGTKERSFILESASFRDNDFIPSQYTAEGKNVSPPLSWKNMPKGTRSLVLISEDPDAPGGSWIHWILFNIPPTLNHLEEGGKNFTKDLRRGKNSWGKLTYGGPNPPSGTHHYRFMLYALDTILELKEGSGEAQLRRAMQGHILGETTLIGLYQLQKKDS